MISDAIIVSIVLLIAAKSPAAPCKYTPRMDACKDEYPCANKDVIIPVSTSPQPAVAIPGLPVVLKNNSPAGEEMEVFAPFKNIKFNYVFHATCKAPT